MGNFWKDFGSGFVRGFDGAKSVVDVIPGVNVISKQIPKLSKLHAGGKVPKTANYRLSAGEVVLNKGQQTALKSAKTAKGKQKVIAAVSKRRPKKMKGGHK
jgi:hypothetical protein